MFNVFDEVSRYAADDGIWQDVPVHDGTGCDDGITADSDTSHYGRIGPDPGAFIQDDPAGHELTPFIRVRMMIERSQDDIMADEDIITDENAALVLELAAAIEEDMLANMDILAKICIKWWKEGKGIIDRTADEP